MAKRVYDVAGVLGKGCKVRALFVRMHVWPWWAVHAMAV
jgi:hypothetical protein